MLGGVRAFRNGTELDLGSPQQRTMLAVLLLHEGQVVQWADLIAAVWADGPPRAALGTLRTYASRLRRVLSPAAIDATAGGYALRPGQFELDLTVFRALVHRGRSARAAGRNREAAALLAEALDGWRGVPLAGVPGGYAEARRAGLSELHLAVQLERIALDLEEGRAGTVIPQLTAMVEAHPLRERPRELLMSGLSRAGRRAEALATFAEGRRLLADGLGMDPGPGLQEMFRQIVRIAPAPAQLPRAPADFTGRVRELDRLVDRLRGPGSPIAGITGPPGVGKSVLAARAGHRLRDAFPDGQLYADLRESGEDVPARFRGAFGPSGRWPEILAGRRVLVVLDHADDPERVRALLPAVAGCAAIVTGRRPLPGLPGVSWSELAGFAPDEGVELLARMAGERRVRAEPAAARRVVAACGGIPGRLRICGARLASRPEWTVASLAAWVIADGG
ncbi:hypothetical protein Ate02nite_92510 [Paractinoplanes tereljensis]|uniref:OmpR/PhoB-type domain-containing protein n=1 Tax=Paractinoplanes tereljensis TaxID=571912 RepID=A0A919NWC8_9ACTN|nr:hypothetical protein Ate02nite_92510 [Actinoplanes tereljensis]